MAGIDINEEIDSIMDEETTLMDYEGKDKIVSSFDLKHKLGDKAQNTKTISTGFGDLDRLTNGFHGGQLIIVSGMTGEGKTTFCRSLTYKMSNNDKNCLWFSYEEDALRFFDKFPKLPLFYLPEVLTDNTLDWITNRIIEAKLKYVTEIVFIDHLHYLVDMSVKMNMSLHIGGLVRSLKLLALKENIVIVLIAHLQKIRPSEEGPGLSDLRDSSFIGQEADKVFMVMRSGKEENVVKISVAKDRDTGKKNKFVRLVFVNKMYEEYANENY